MPGDAGQDDAGAELLEVAAVAAQLGRQELRGALQSVTDAGVSLTGAEYGAFFYSGEDEEGERLDLYVLSGSAGAAFPDEVPVRHSRLFAPTFSGLGVVRIADVLADPRYGGNASGGMPEPHLLVRSYLAVPVVTPEAQVLGALLFGHSRPGEFDERAEVAAQAVAAHAATAAENARLLAEARRARDSAEASARRIELLQHITALLSTAASTAEIMSRVPTAVTAALGCSGSHLMLLDDLEQALVGAPSAALPAPTRQRFTRVPLAVSTPSTRAVLTRAPVLAVGEDLRRFDGLRGVDLGRTRAALAVPLQDQLRRPVGALTATWDDESSLSHEVTGLLLAVAGQVAQALERSRLYDAERRVRTQLAQSVEALTDLARELQSGLLPRQVPDLDRVEVAVRYQPAVSGAEVGGDWYDVITAEDGTVTFVIGDVQGHNTTAAGLMGQLRTAVRAYIAEGHDPATALARTNALLLQMDAELFATCCLLQLDQASGELVVASAGHPAPLLLLGDAPAEELEVTPGPPLGILEDSTYVSRHLRLRGRARVLLHTDGVVESAADSVELGLATVKRVAHELRARSCAVIADGVLAGIPHRLTDDAALLVLDYAGPDAGREDVATDLPPELRSVGHARRFLRGVLAGWDVDEETVADAELVTSELVANAVTHTGTRAELLITREADRRLLRISVGDSSTRHPAPRDAAPDALGGRGLGIVDALAEAWGVADHGDGKVVWAELRLRGPA